MSFVLLQKNSCAYEWKTLRFCWYCGGEPDPEDFPCWCRCHYCFFCSLPGYLPWYLPWVICADLKKPTQSVRLLPFFNHSLFWHETLCFLFLTVNFCFWGASFLHGVFWWVWFVRVSSVRWWRLSLWQIGNPDIPVPPCCFP